MAKQHTIIAIKQNVLVKRDEAHEYDVGEHGVANLSIMSMPELDGVVIYIPLPGESDKAHEIVVSKAMLKAYINDLR